MSPRILIVDDDRDTQAMMHAYLASSGYEPTTVGTLHAGMQALSEFPPHLLITDLRLQGYNGLQLIATCPRSIPSIVVTGFGDPVLETEARQMGAEYLVKPVALPALLEVITEKLTGDSQKVTHSRPRRWARKPITADLRASVDNAPVRIVDVSYGGVRFEFERLPGRWLPLSFDLALPTAHLSIGVDVVWKSRTGESRWLCGATVSDNRPMWRELVDAIS
jgi:CheY-like chemotaxis protein